MTVNYRPIPCTRYDKTRTRHNSTGVGTCPGGSKPPPPIDPPRTRSTSRARHSTEALQRTNRPTDGPAYPTMPPTISSTWERPSQNREAASLMLEAASATLDAMRSQRDSARRLQKDSAPRNLRPRPTRRGGGRLGRSRSRPHRSCSGDAVGGGRVGHGCRRAGARRRRRPWVFGGSW